MEANLCLRTPNFPAMCHHKNFMVHSSVRLPALQAKVGPPPSAARVAVVGAGVVLACALGTMYWKRVRALQLPMHHNSLTSHEGGNGNDHLASGGIVSIGELHSLLSEICIGTSDPKLPQLTELIDQSLTEKEIKNVRKDQCLSDVLENFFPKTTPGEHDYNLGFVLTLTLLTEKKYGKAEEICNKLHKIASPSDGRPNLLLAIINMMMAMESMLQFPTTSTFDLKEKLEQVEKAWDEYHNKPDFQEAPPQID